MADDAETNVIPCKWKKTTHGYRLWVRGRPDVFGEAESFEDAEQALTDAIWEAAEDLDAVIPTVPEYDPPLPASAIGEQFLKPELYLVIGHGVFDIEARAYARNEWRESREACLQERFALLDSMYTGGLCRTCKHGIGDRTDKSFPIGSCDSAYDGGSIRNCYGFSASLGHVYSDDFISLLRPREKARLEFRPLTISGKRPRRKYSELLSAPEVPFAGVKGFDTAGYECGDCGSRHFYVDEPSLNQGGFSINDFICRCDLPDPLPSCFVVGARHQTYLCLTRERWDQMRGKRGTKGISGRRPGVVSPEQCDRHPRLWKNAKPCDACRQWVSPVTVGGKERCVWDLPANTCTAEACSGRNLKWIAEAAEAGLIQIVRQTISIREMQALIDSGTKPKRVEVISFRCPQCWQLGQVYIDRRELHLGWHGPYQRG